MTDGAELDEAGLDHTELDERGLDVAGRDDSGRAAPLGETEVAIVGSGFSGLAMAIRLRRAGRRDFVVLEKEGDLGGTWRDNTYPGCACDVESHLYSFSFAPNPDWSRAFSPQPEIWAYLRRVARDEGVLPHVRFGCALEEARFSEDTGRWVLRTPQGVLHARYLVSACGPLSEPSIPRLPGLDRFEGEAFHSARWPSALDLTGRRVAVIGTGASAIQFVPRIQPQVEQLHVFQRTPAWVLPRRDRAIPERTRRLFRRAPLAHRAQREWLYWTRELYAVMLLDARLSRVVERLARWHLARQVPDEALRAKLTPSFAPGCKRLLISDDYYPALARPNVELVTDGVKDVRARSIVGADGRERPIDTLIFGTGFHVTDPPIAEHVYGRGGRSLAAAWADGMRAHRGTTVPGFPNLFLLLGPNTGLGHTSVVIMAEAQVEYAMRAIEHADAHGIDTLEPTPSAEAAWNERVQRRTRGTVWTAGGCDSWYLDAHGRNTTLWPDFTFRFRKELARFVPEEHRLVRGRSANVSEPWAETVMAGARG